MRKRDFEFYLRQLGVVLEIMPSSDLIIALLVSGQNLVERKNARGREFERIIPDKELILEAELSNQLIDKMKKDGWPILVIDTDEINFAHSKEGKAETLSLIEQSLRKYVYLPDRKYLTIRYR